MKNIGRGLFDGEHSFEVRASGSERSRFIHSERFSGLLVPLIWRQLEEPTRGGFDAINAALKQRMEGRQAPTDQGKNA